MKQKDDMSIISLLVRSKKRIKVLKSLEKENKIPQKLVKILTIIAIMYLNI